MASTYVHLNKRFYCTMNEYNGETYVHIRHRYDTSKRLSMRYAEMLEVIESKANLERSYEQLQKQLREEGEERSGGSECDEAVEDEDVAYRESKRVLPPTATNFSSSSATTSSSYQSPKKRRKEQKGSSSSK